LVDLELGHDGLQNCKALQTACFRLSVGEESADEFDLSCSLAVEVTKDQHLDAAFDAKKFPNLLDD
jgi:hypothetical protein